MMRRLVTTTLRSRPPPPPPSSSSLLQRRSFASANATNSAPASPTIIIEANTHTSTSTTDTTDTHTNQTTPGWGLFPEDIVQHLDRYVIGQEDAKKATAIALRMRWRRNQLEDDIRGEVTPSNIMMKGPTGSGKTEIARRLSTLAEAPFIKVEATRYTEVGFVGANTSDMIKGLMDNAVALELRLAKKKVAEIAREKAEIKVLELLRLPGTNLGTSNKTTNNNNNSSSSNAAVMSDLREKLRQGVYDHLTVKVPASSSRSGFSSSSGVGAAGGGNPLSDLLEGLGDLGNIGMGNSGFITIERAPGAGRRGRGGGGGGGGGGGEKQVLSVKKALERFEEEIQEELTSEEEVVEKAKAKAENYGIVFIDEIDKLCGGGSGDAATAGGGGRNASENKGEGVQRELLTLVEGCSVQTRYGPIKTDFILFIASGAFHRKSPADLLPELQGRFPVRVELKPLGKADLIKILSQKKFNLLEQTRRLLATEGVELEFTECGIEEMAGFAQQINGSQQDIGARRLNTILFRVLEELNFMAPRLRGTKIVVDAAFVKDRLKDFDLTRADNLARYIL